MFLFSSEKMQIRNELLKMVDEAASEAEEERRDPALADLIKQALTVLKFAELNEREISDLVQLGFEEKINFGGAGGFSNITNIPALEDFSCIGAVPFTCSKDQKYRYLNGLCNNLENLVRRLCFL